MLVSSHFGIARRSEDDWFDAILDADTELFLDPFFVFKESEGFWAGAHDEIIRHFDRAFLLIAEGNRNPQSLQYRKALHLLMFREPKELCLGYTATGTAGLGSGIGFARSIASAISAAITRGLIHPRHFEELGVLNKGIGSDRISDITCTILKHRLLTYTQEIARRHGIPMEWHRIYAAEFDEQRLRWRIPEVEAPTNPYTGGPFLFVPQRFLNDLPTLNADDWWDHYENEELRDDLNYEIMGRVNKATIIEVARLHPESVRQWTIDKEAEQVSPYDFSKDPKGVWQWDPVTQSFTQSHPLRISPPQSDEEFFSIIELVIGQFRLFIEEQGGWSLLWDTPYAQEKPEHATQLLFRGIAQNYCRANNISLDAEVNLGRGPVDFKFSNGYVHRAHLEVKKLHNGIGDAAEIRRSARRRQKNDRRDAELILDLLVKGDFPRLHKPSAVSREILSQLRYRSRLVKIRTQAKNSLRALSIRAGLPTKANLFTRRGGDKLKALPMSEAANLQRRHWLAIVKDLNEKIAEVDNWLKRQARADERVTLLQTHPGIGLLTSLGIVHTLDPVTRFSSTRKVAAYVGLEPREWSSGEKKRLLGISKAGPRLLRYLIIEAAHTAVKYDERLKLFYQRLQKSKGKARAMVAVGRKLLIRGFIMLRDGVDYAEFVRKGIEAGLPETEHRLNA